MERPRLTRRIFAPGGFTLFELLLVLIIVGLAAAVAVPRWVAAMPGVQLNAAARKCSAVLRYAGELAVAEQRIYRGTVSITEQRVSLEPFEPEDAAEASGAPPAAAFDYRLPGDVTIASARDGEGSPRPDRLDVYFFPGGGNSGGRITLVNSRGRRLILALDFITGEVRVQSPEAK